MARSARDYNSDQRLSSRGGRPGKDGENEQERVVTKEGGHGRLRRDKCWAGRRRSGGHVYGRPCRWRDRGPDDRQLLQHYRPAARWIPSVSPEGSSFAELGNEVTLANPGPLSSVTVSMSSWACGSGTWWVGNCETTPGATFPVPITLKIYSAGQGNAPGPQIATETGTFNIPFRPSKSPECEYSMPGGWYEATNKTCHDVLLTTSRSVTSPRPTNRCRATVIYGIAYNTSRTGTPARGNLCADPWRPVPR